MDGHPISRNVPFASARPMEPREARAMVLKPCYAPQLAPHYASANLGRGIGFR